MTASRRPHVVIAGGSGFHGRGLARILHERGHDVAILSRGDGEPRESRVVGRGSSGFLPGTRWLRWDGRTLGDWAGCLDVGRSVDCRKTPENKRSILTSPYVGMEWEKAFRQAHLPEQRAGCCA